MDDSISRQAAIDAVHKNYDTILDFKSDGRTVADSFEDIINALPPEQSERKKGEWVNIRDGNIADCGRCNARGRAWMNFCPICGADMRREQNETD